MALPRWGGFRDRYEHQQKAAPANRGGKMGKRRLRPEQLARGGGG
jgi:hypothetical protein